LTALCIFDSVSWHVQLDLESKVDVKRELNVFKFNPDFEAAQAEWAAIRKELLGGESDGDEDESGSGSGDDDGEESDEELPGPPGTHGAAPGAPAGPTQARCIPCTVSTAAARHAALLHAHHAAAAQQPAAIFFFSIMHLCCH
jgi:hypothetical protein